jgi:hypothetical protein
VILGKDYKELLSAADSLYLEGGPCIPTELTLFDREETNIRAGQAWAEKNLEENPSAVKLCKSYLTQEYMSSISACIFGKR